MLESLNTKEKEFFKKTLEDLIEQTYAVEKEYKELNASYKNLQDFIKQIIEVLPNALWVIDDNGEVFLQNSEAKKCDGLIKKIDFTKESDEIEYENLYYLIKINRAYGRTIISATDITQEKRGERLASMGQVAAHLSHEIRNPIGSVSLMASTLYKRVTPKNKPLVEEIKKAIWRVERIVKATLLFTKGVSINPSIFAVKDIIADLDSAISYYSFSKDITFDFDKQNTTIRADFDLLSIVLQNFIFNAIDAIEESDKESGTVKIKFFQTEKADIFHIIDTGMDFEDKNILYEPFKTTKTKGQGLGLALSLEIINAHGGTIDFIENEKGFAISLPNNRQKKGKD
ncbi:MAG: HAMP domain-containing histidine kinase [Epsilonproteobacteria bacterium]|nr:HAMP domain-containing histidine kinase [Campylobacterota bacterium]